MRNAAIASVVLHLVMGALLFFGITNPFQRTLKDNKPMVIDFVQISEKSAAPKLAPTNEKIEEKQSKSETPSSESSPPEPAESAPETPSSAEDKKTKETPIDKTVPSQKQKDDALALKPVKKKKEPLKKAKPEEKGSDKKKQKQKKSSEEKAEVNLRKKKATVSDKKTEKKKQATAALNDLLKEVDKEGSSQQGSPAETVGEVITATQIDAIRQKIRKCWLVPAGVKGARDMVVDIKMEISSDGTVLKADIVNKARMASDTAFRTAAESARRAVLDPHCNPLPLPHDKYEQWKDLELSFNPKDMY